MPIVFGCTPDQIARNIREIRADTRAYVGPLEPGIFDRLGNIEHVYTSFPEGKIRRDKLKIGDKTKEELKAELKSAEDRDEIHVSSYAQAMLDSPDFVIEEKEDDIDLIHITVGALGFKNWATTDDVYKRVDALGLEFCPPEVGPKLRLKDTNQPMGKWYYIGMKQIPGRDDYPVVFHLEHYEDGLWLHAYWARPDYEWPPGNEFVFRLRKRVEPQTLQLSGIFGRLFKR